MARLTPEMQSRRAQRIERMRRDRMRRRRQTVAVILAIVVVAVIGIAFALRPASGSATAPAAASSSAATRTANAGAATTRAPAAHAATTSASPAAPANTPAKPPTTDNVVKVVLKALKPAPGVKTIVVDKSEQRVTLYKPDGTPVDSFRCASGILYPRVGRYKVYGHRQQSWSLYDNSTFFYFTQFVKSDKGNNIGFHSIPQKPDGTLEGKLGTPVSHGCVRLAKAKAKFLYSWAPNGTRVVVKK